MKKVNKMIFIMLLCSLLIPINSYALTKTETVYANITLDGSVKKVSVTNKLSNIDKGDILDYSNLIDIKNLNGDESFSRDNEHLTWKSTGKDIVYQGKTKDNLPIEVTTKYYLDGKIVNPNDIVGKSGNIKIEYTFNNLEYNYSSGMHTPFVVSLVSLMDTKSNSNFSISTGKVVSSGTRNILIGIATPALYNDLGISELKSMDNITISYKTDKFKINDTYFVMTPKLLDEVDISKLDKLGEVNSAMNKLQDGVNKLEEGSIELNKGSFNLLNGMNELNSGIKKALDGSNTITEGLDKVSEGSNKLSSLNTLIDMLYSSYKENLELLNKITSGDAKKSYEAGISDATNKKTDLENKLIEVNAGISSLEQAESLGVITEEGKNTLATLKTQKTQIEAGIKAYAEGISEAEKNLASLPVAEAKLEGANEAIIKILMGILDINNPKDINDVTINKFKTNIEDLLRGINSLKDGSNTLTNGLDELYSGSNKLVNGTNRLNSGTKELSNGISTINSEGIKKLSSYATKINSYSNKVKILTNLSKNYNGFTSTNSDNTIFIYKITK